MNRNIYIVIVILAVVLLAFYLVWMRNRVQSPAVATPRPTAVPVVTPLTSPSPAATASATPIVPVRPGRATESGVPQ